MMECDLKYKFCLIDFYFFCNLTRIFFFSELGEQRSEIIVFFWEK